MEGVDPEQVNLNDKNRNAFFYACENNHKEMLQTLIDYFDVNTEQTVWLNGLGSRCNQIRCTGFVLACYKGYYDIV